MSSAKITIVDPKDEAKALEEFNANVLPTLEGKNGLLILLGMTSSQGVPGSFVDLNNMETLFKSEKVNFAVWRIENPTKEKIPAVMKVASSCSYPETIDKVFVYYSGHGGNEKGQKFIIPQGEIGVRSYIKEDIILFFEPPPVSKLGPNVKRVYLFDSCLSPARNDNNEVAPKVQDASFGDLRQPLIIGHSTSMEQKATGKPSDGGEWTNALCKFIKELPFLPFSYILDKTWKEVVNSTTGGQYVQGPHYLNYMGLFFLKDEYKAQFYERNTVKAVESGEGAFQPPNTGGGGGGGGNEPPGEDGDIPDLQKMYNVTPDQADMKAALEELAKAGREAWRDRFGARLKGPSGYQINFCTKLEYLIENMYTYGHPFTWGVVLNALDNPVPIKGNDKKKISTSVREYMAKNYQKYVK